MRDPRLGCVCLAKLAERGNVSSSYAWKMGQTVDKNKKSLISIVFLGVEVNPVRSSANSRLYQGLSYVYPHRIVLGQ